MTEGFIRLRSKILVPVAGRLYHFFYSDALGFCKEVYPYYITRSGRLRAPACCSTTFEGFRPERMGQFRDDQYIFEMYSTDENYYKNQAHFLKK